MLERKHGSGNYVRATGSPGSIYALFRLELVNGGGSPTATVLSVDRVPKDAGVGPIGPSREGHRIRRLRRLDGAPVALEEIWLDGNRAKRITDAHLSDSLYLYYKLRFGIWIARAEDRISVSSVPDWTTPAFDLPAGSTCGYIERFGSTSDGERIEFSRTWFDHRCARYVSRIK
jgi:GntR family transcriptional regulator